jgi:ATP-dependent helicase/nuclease subunit B
LGLRPLDPLRTQPDAALRGSTIHKILERFALAFPKDLPEDAEGQLLSIADDVLAKLAPWPVVRRLWYARMVRVAPWFIRTEIERRAFADFWLPEVKGRWPVPGLPQARTITLVGKADRIDRLKDGRIAIYDYKSGKPPTEKEERSFSKQLWLEAAMAADGAFGDDGPLETARIAYIGLGATPSVVAHDPTSDEIETLKSEFRRLLAHFSSETSGFPSRRAVANTRWAGDYDHLARYGEWDETQPATPRPVGEAKRCRNR